MKKEVKEKTDNFLIVIYSLFLDGLLVMFVGFITKLVERFVGYMYGMPINQIENLAVKNVIFISKILIIAIAVLYAFFDIYETIKKIIKKI